jgi:glycosyltransferase involved in cell wall biosynthesis
VPGNLACGPCIRQITSKSEPSSVPIILFSIVIAVFNDWYSCDGCLQSLAEQVAAPSFEVIVVDDGSPEAAPEFVHRWCHHYPLTVVRQSHAGAAAARNRGSRISRGSILLFVDADCRFQANCLSTLHSTILCSPQHSSFQLHLIGDCSGLVGRAEELRLMALQNQTLQADGRIRYLNTAGFAIRRQRVDLEAGIFDPAALRGEDTLLLTSLIEAGELPLFVKGAVVQHCVGLSLMRCFVKDIRSAYLEAAAYRMMGSKRVTVQLSYRERLNILRSMWKAAGERSIGRAGWFVVVAREALESLIAFFCRFAHGPARTA